MLFQSLFDAQVSISNIVHVHTSNIFVILYLLYSARSFLTIFSTFELISIQCE